LVDDLTVESQEGCCGLTICTDHETGHCGQRTYNNGMACTLYVSPLVISQDEDCW